MTLGQAQAMKCYACGKNGHISRNFTLSQAVQMNHY
jgi:hypothetical protein